MTSELPDFLPDGKPAPRNTLPSKASAKAPREIVRRKHAGDDRRTGGAAAAGFATDFDAFDDDEDLDFDDGLSVPLDNAELVDLFDEADQDVQTEATEGPQAGAIVEPGVLRVTLEQREHRMKRADTAASVLAAVGGIPAPGESWHILANGTFDAWNLLTGLLAELGTAGAYLNTWTMNYEYAVELMALIDAGTLAPVDFMSSQNLRSRRPAVYATLLHGLRRRSCRFACLPTNTKVTLLRNEAAGAWLTMEGSANYNGNPRLEQYVLTNSRQVHDFHRSWMDAAFDHAARGKGSD